MDDEDEGSNADDTAASEETIWRGGWNTNPLVVIQVSGIVIDGVTIIPGYIGSDEVRAIYFDDSNSELRDITIQNCIFRDMAPLGDG